jgi:uncharacterized protein (DUF2252 family)
MDKLNVIEFLKKANQDRDPSKTTLKYKAIRKDVFRFFRGTPELFYQRLSTDSDLFDAPKVWVCGDLHLENFGSYKSDDRQVYFDINDFDGGTLQSCLLDAYRMTASILVAREILQIKPSQVTALATSYLQAYFTHLKAGNIRMVSADTQPGDVGKILRILQPLKRKAFLEESIEMSGKKTPGIRLVPGKRESIPNDLKSGLLDALGKWAKDQPDPKFYKPLDVCIRVAGTGSLGVERYLVLIAGLDAPNGYRLLDVKESRPSFVPNAPASEIPEALRIVHVIQRVVANPPALLGHFEREGKSFLVREYRGSGENTPLTALSGKYKKTLDFVDLLGALTAWDHLRGGGKKGSANADVLMDIGDRQEVWMKRVLDAAKEAATQVQADYKVYCKAFDQGELIN